MLKIYQQIIKIILISFIFINPSFAADSNNPITKLGEVVEDSAITLGVYGQFIGNKMLNKLDISVTTEKQVVTLIGVVKTKAQKDKAVELVSGLNGVKKVNADHLLIQKSKQPLTDSWITFKVKAVLLKNQLMKKSANYDLADIEVTTKDGTIYLSGKKTQVQSTNAQKIAENIKGMSKKVVNQREVIN